MLYQHLVLLENWSNPSYSACPRHNLCALDGPERGETPCLRMGTPRICLPPPHLRRLVLMSCERPRGVYIQNNLRLSNWGLRDVGKPVFLIKDHVWYSVALASRTPRWNKNANPSPVCLYLFVSIYRAPSIARCTAPDHTMPLDDKSHSHWLCHWTTVPKKKRVKRNS